MLRLPFVTRMLLIPVLLVWAAAPLPAQIQTPVVPTYQLTETESTQIKSKLQELQAAVAELKKGTADPRLIADVEVHAKAAEWILRHQEFYKPAFVQQTVDVLDTGLKRAAELAVGKSPWVAAKGRTIRGYTSSVDGSVQPYAITLPEGHGTAETKRWPVHVVLHGRGSDLNEVKFIRSHEGKPAVAGEDWIQLDVFGRTNNGYRWSGETDVFEALADVRRRNFVDDRRIVLRGFSMGGAGAWHLGLHHPTEWCSVGPGAGFIDFYEYQKQTAQRPFYQHEALKIYDSIEYALNAYNVPICTYGGEKDAQLVASTAMVAAAEKLQVPVKLLIGPGVGHTFHPDSYKEYMAFHRSQQEQGRAGHPAPSKLRFVTHTLKYNRCGWISIEEMMKQYGRTTVEAEMNNRTGILKVTTSNVAVLQIARDVADQVEIDGTLLELAEAAERLLPGVYYEFYNDKWHLIDYETSLNFEKNVDNRKRRNLQGPIDDAFMGPFVCVKGTGEAWSAPQAAWANWTLERFSQEFDKWLRGRVPVVNDTELTPEMIDDKNIVLFGDPGSNKVLAQILDKLPIQWTKDALVVNGEKYDPATHGVALIYPNPLNPHRYVVINSGHTFHEADFRNSNAWLFPRLGDIAVQKFEPLTGGGYKETIVWADFFNTGWKLPSGLAPKVAAEPK